MSGGKRQTDLDGHSTRTNGKGQARPTLGRWDEAQGQVGGQKMGLSPKRQRRDRSSQRSPGCSQELEYWRYTGLERGWGLYTALYSAICTAQRISPCAAGGVCLLMDDHSMNSSTSYLRYGGTDSKSPLLAFLAVTQCQLLCIHQSDFDMFISFYTKCGVLRVITDQVVS